MSYCFDLVAYCNLAVFMANSIFNPTCADDGSVNVYIYICRYMYVCVLQKLRKSLPAMLVF